MHWVKAPAPRRRQPVPTALPLSPLLSSGLCCSFTCLCNAEKTQKQPRPPCICMMRAGQGKIGMQQDIFHHEATPGNDGGGGGRDRLAFPALAVLSVAASCLAGIRVRPAIAAHRVVIIRAHPAHAAGADPAGGHFGRKDGCHGCFDGLGPVREPGPRQAAAPAPAGLEQAVVFGVGCSQAAAGQQAAVSDQVGRGAGSGAGRRIVSGGEWGSGRLTRLQARASFCPKPRLLALHGV